MIRIISKNVSTSILVHWSDFWSNSYQIFATCHVLKAQNCVTRKKYILFKIENKNNTACFNENFDTICTRLWDKN